jgi:hypothetical protein
MSHFSTKQSRISLSLLLFGLLFASLSVSMVTVVSADGGSVPAEEQDRKYEIQWMDTVYDAVRAETVNAPAASRVYAYAGVAYYEAIVNGMSSFNSLAGQIESMPDMPLPDFNKTYDWPTVAAATMDTAMSDLFSQASDETLQSFHDLKAQQVEERSADLSASVINRSLEYGEAVGVAINDWVSTDNYQETRSMTWDIPSGDPSLWVATRENGNPAEPFWGQIRPFGLSYADECAVPLNMEYSEDENSTFYAQAMEVKEVGDNLTEEQKATSRWWLDAPGQTGAPSGHWVKIEGLLAEQLDLALDRSAMMYAMTGITLADAFIGCWSLKYQVNLLRPETYIHEHIRRSWAPYVQTPLFPEYPSGHSVASAAAADVLTSLFGIVAFTDTTHVPDGEAPRSFTSIRAAADEAAMSRLYGGIHYRTAIENGITMGECIAQHELNNIQLNSILQGE